MSRSCPRCVARGFNTRCEYCSKAEVEEAHARAREESAGPRPLPQPLGQTDALILECLERVDGALPIKARYLCARLNENELHYIGIGYSELVERLSALVRAGLVSEHFDDANFSVKLAPAARDYLTAPAPEKPPCGELDREADKARQSPARDASGIRPASEPEDRIAPERRESIRPKFAPDGAGDEWEPAA